MPALKVSERLKNSKKGQHLTLGLILQCSEVVYVLMFESFWMSSEQC